MSLFFLSGAKKSNFQKPTYKSDVFKNMKLLLKVKQEKVIIKNLKIIQNNA